jgi:hypothetical protein
MGMRFLVVTFSWWRRWWGIRAAMRAGSPLDLAVDVPVLSSPAMLEPGVFGIFRPVLLLPEGITDRLAPAHLEAILAHELCHVRRRDNLAAAIHMAVEAIFWFHPLVWWLGARLVEERERACDEEVLRLGGQPEVYAESILKTCQFYLESPLVCMSGISGSDLKKRIVRIMTHAIGKKAQLRPKTAVGYRRTCRGSRAHRIRPHERLPKPGPIAGGKQCATALIRCCIDQAEPRGHRPF